MALKYILLLARHLREGEQCEIDAVTFSRAFPPHPFIREHGFVVLRKLLVDGVYDMVRDPKTHAVTIIRQPEGAACPVGEAERPLCQSGCRLTCPFKPDDLLRRPPPATSASEQRA